MEAGSIRFAYFHLLQAQTSTSSIRVLHDGEPVRSAAPTCSHTSTKL